MATRSSKDPGQVFRRIAASLPGAEERAHMNHPDFRVGGRIFATLGYPDKSWGMVKLTPETQPEFVRESPQAFVPVKGAWGLKGCTSVRLDAVDEETLGRALTVAWQFTLRQAQKKKRK